MRYAILICASLCTQVLLQAQAPDLILHNGKVVTVDRAFTVAEAISVSDGRIDRVGSSEDLLSTASPITTTIDLQGKMLLPGLIDSHVHPVGAATYEFDHRVPDVATIADVLKYIGERADLLEDGQWIKVQQMFVTRLKEQRFPTREELDSVAPANPAVYRTGPDLAVNSLALKLSGIDESFVLPASSSGRIERDANGRINGIVRGASETIKYEGSDHRPSEKQQLKLLTDLLADYNSVGITSISDRNANAQALSLYQQLLENDQLTCRVYVYHGIDPNAEPAALRKKLEQLTSHPLHAYNSMLWLRGVKVFLDGGMLTGSAYMQQPWGVSDIYSINDPAYRGTLKIEPERLYQVSKMVLEHGLQMTAHSVGDGAVHNLIDAYERVNQDFSVAQLRPCITHCNFMSADAITRMKQLGIVADLQPAWLYLDGATLSKQFGDQRTAFFQPYRSLFDAGIVVGGGSDHMQKIGSLRSVNPYNPFLGMWITLTRNARAKNTPVHLTQKISREEAIRLYTINNAHLTFEESTKGSLEPGKVADMIIVDRNLLSCDVDDVRDTNVVSTYLGGKVVYQSR